MKKLYAILLGFILLGVTGIKAQTTSTDTSSIHIDYLILSGSFGAGGQISSNIVGSGAVVPTSFDFLIQLKHHRIGFGYTHEFRVTPENMAMFITGNDGNIDKGYLQYEWTIFRNFPVNLGFSTQLGGFSYSFEDVESSDESRLFGNIGVVFEVGAPRFYLFVRPAVEYKSYSGFHKEIQGTVSLGLRWKIITEEEKARKAAKKKR